MFIKTHHSVFLLFCSNIFTCIQGRSNVGEKKRWSSVRSYLCGDDFNSVLAVDDSGSIKDSDALITMSQQLSSDLVLPSDSVSVKSSEATVTQPFLDSYVKEDVDIQSEATETHIPKKHQTTPISKLLLEQDAAVIIQSAFRSYLVSFCCILLFVSTPLILIMCCSGNTSKKRSVCC